ncbi:MAG: glyoxalase [Acidobacteria bacterium]|nr:glyoxalase [Acidobacteriota bacterium]MBS1865628.1 glyoxalase [Acidobacteriota bacterium]
MATAKPTPAAGSSIIPGMRYRNAPIAIDWLCNAFGFEKHLVVPGENNTVVHAQLAFGAGMIMLGSIKDNEFSKLMKQPDEIGGAETQSCYVVVSDCDAHYARAKAAGAEIIMDIRDEAHGGRSYACRDLEGHIWYFGSYDPWHS